MKLHILIITMALAGVAGAAAADNIGPATSRTLTPQELVTHCALPTSATACKDLHRAIRFNFRDREVAMLFGAGSVYPQYRNGGIERLQVRYQTWLKAYLAEQQAIKTAKVEVGR